jgi:outer membrane protein OmpA-like peptidoglycan-associated protein
VKGRIAHRSCLAAGAAAIVAATAGCHSGLGAQVDGASTGASATLTSHVAPSMLVAVAGRAGTGQFGQIIPATARPREDLAVLKAQTRGRAAIASQSPPPARVTVPGPPRSPGPGSSAYQQARYRKARAAWRAEVAAGRRSVATRTGAATAAWVHSLRLGAALAGPSPSAAAASLPAECTLAASAASGLVDQAGNEFGTRRVLLLDVTSLGGTLPKGELNGDDVIVTTSYLPTSAAASAAQASLLAAGAAHAAVLGPEVTPGQLDQLVTNGLSQRTVTESLSGPALFANNSSVLLPTAAAVLVRLVGPLRGPDATGVVNGYASTPGTAAHNQKLSQARATAVATFLQAHGVPKSHLLVVGHGATDLVASGPSGDNRRVVVVIEEPSSS